VKPSLVNTHKTSATKAKTAGAVAEKSAHPKIATASPKKKTAADATVAGSSASASAAGDKPAADEPATPDTKWSGKRDPFISPVVSRANGPSSCSTGKKCLEIGTINLRGIVHAESGFIAVVSNSLNKAYFLRENDPVFNGYVVKITGDSVVFQETLQDRLGKTFTREVVKKITIPAV
jgi:Tfp pilus assembly protein PilP